MNIWARAHQRHLICILGFHVTYSIPKLKITFPYEVFVTSDKRPYRNLTFHNVLVWQGSSFCNRARLNFQACVAWHEHGGPSRLSRGSKDELVCANWTVLALEKVILSVCQSFRITTFFNSKTSANLRPPCLCSFEGHKHGVFIQSSISLCVTLLPLTREWKTEETWFLVRLFI